MISKIFAKTIVLTLISFHASALTCERYRLDTSGFQTKAAAESYYPKVLTLDNSDFKPKGGDSKQMRFDTSYSENRTGISHRTIFSLLPNGKLIAALQGRAGYAPPGQAKYKCDLNAIELRELVEKNPSPQKTEVNSNSASNSGGSNNNSNSSTEKAEKKCSEIGYTKGTEKYADCVMKLMN